MPFLVFRRDHSRSRSGIIRGSGSFAVQFGDHFRSGDHLGSGIICGAVQLNGQENQKKTSCNRNGISARAEKQETIWLLLGSRSDFSGIKAIK